MKLKQWIVFSLLSFMGIWFASCVLHKEKTHLPSQDEKSQNPAYQLVEIWILQSMEGLQAGIIRELPRLEFRTDNTVSGFTGCNSLMGRFDTENNSLRFSPNMAVTKKLCGHDIEPRFINMIQKVGQFERKGNELTLLSASGQWLATFQKAG